jgi:hypothetical protein
MPLSLFTQMAIVIVALFSAPLVEPRRVLAQDQEPPCPAYVIEGSIGMAPLDDAEAPRMASVYVHTTGQPLANRQVVATFSDASGSAIGEPAVLVTDAGGRAAVEVPPTAESVNFVGESPDSPGCAGEGDSDPRVLLEIVPVIGPTADLPDGPPVADGPDEVLAKTGPVSDVIALASLLLLAFGAAVGTGRGRRRALSAGARGVKTPISR